MCTGHITSFKAHSILTPTLQGKKVFTLNTELTKRLSQFKTLEDFRTPVSAVWFDLIIQCTCTLSRNDYCSNKHRLVKH